MADDIVTQLRQRADERKEACEQYWNGHKFECEIPILENSAADEIERLRLQLLQWRRIADVCVIAIGVPKNDTECLAVEFYGNAVRGNV